MKTIAGDATDALGLALCNRIGKKRYDLWFVGNTRFACQDGRLTVGVPNLFYHDWLQKSYAAEVAATATEVFGKPVDVRFVIDAELFRAVRRQSDAPMPLFDQEPQAEARRDARVGAPDRKPAVRPARRFRRLEDFVVGPCNRVAHAAALHLVESAGDVPIPLVLHGPVGTGKTHLLEGIYCGLRRAQTDWRPVFLSAEDFTNRFVQAMHQGKLSSFRKQFRECDALFIDDIHFLARKNATQEEFLHTFDALHAEERPVVLTCDGHPRFVDQLLAELTDRLLGGAVWEVTLPDRSTRVELVRQKSLAPNRAPMPEDVVEFLADQLKGNVRELEGAIHSVFHFARAHSRRVDLALAKEALADVLRYSVRLVQLTDVEHAVAAVLGLDAKALQSRKRGWMTSHPRMLAMYLARKHTPATYTEIGQCFGGLNHSTAVAGEKKVRQWIADNAMLNVGRLLPVRDVLEKIERELMR